MAYSPIGSALNWEKCIFCQKDIPRSKLVCPGDSKRSDVGLGYKKLADTVQGFLEMNMLPLEINISGWDEGMGIESTCSLHKACWHPQCRNILHSTTLERHRKRELNNNVEQISMLVDQEDVENDNDSLNTFSKIPRITRLTSGSVSTDFTSLCFFCGKPSLPNDKLRQALTDNVHNRVLKSATLLGDSMLLAKLANDHMSSREHKYHSSCLLALYYKASRIETVTHVDPCQSFVDTDSIAFAEISA